MPEFPRWRTAWIGELIHRIDQEPSLLAGCPRPVAQCLAEIVKPTGELPERLEHEFCEPWKHREREEAKIATQNRLSDAFRRATQP